MPQPIFPAGLKLRGDIRSSEGVTAGGGLEAPVKWMKLVSQVRYTRWAKDPTPPRIR
jgi:hypothetical protein